MPRSEVMLDRVDRLLAVWDGNRPEDSAEPPTLSTPLKSSWFQSPSSGRKAHRATEIRKRQLSQTLIAGAA
jgi:hypothetical protein